MISMPSKHPDIEEFIDIKRDVDMITKANISVEIDDEFMLAVKNNRPYKLNFTTHKGELIEKEINALKVFHRMAENNWWSGEPGALFWGKISTHHLLSEDKTFEYAGVNPCGEQVLPGGSACLLGHINLSKYVISRFTKNAYFDFDKFKEAVRDSVLGLNEVLEEGLDHYPLPTQKEAVLDYRQIGLGIFGLADMFIQLGYTYGDDNSFDISHKIGRVLINEAVRQSALIAKEKGTFRKYNYDVISKSKFYQDNIDDDVKELVEKYGLRNSHLLTSAPTGSISSLIGTSGGIEPVFAFSYIRGSHNEDLDTFSYKIYAKIALEYMDRFGVSEDELPEYFISSQEIPYQDRIKMQSIWQQYIDASISSTINLPEEATVNDIMNIYMLAWENGLKGVTVYRDNCARQGVLHLEKKEKGNKNSKEVCPSCGADAMVHSNGCETCQECGYSPCSI